MNNIKILLLSLFTIVLSAGCQKDVSDFSGGDNYISSFQLKQGQVTLNATISNGSIVLTAPENFSLENATATVVISENATIDPNPGTITNWDGEHTFTITSYNGKKNTYQYSAQRKVIAKEGDIVLLTQADVDALAALHLSQIDGSLTIGSATGRDSIYSLTSLSTLREIAYGLTVNATYAGSDLAGLENLTKTGSLQIQQNKSLKTVSFPKLISVMSNLVVNQSQMTALSFPELVNIDKGLEVISCNALASMEFPKLKNIVENLTLTAATTSTLSTIDFPLLEKAGGNISITNWKEVSGVNMPLLTVSTAVSVSGLPKLTTLNVPKLKSTWNNVSLSSLPLMVTMDFSSLQTIGGELNLTGLSQLKNTQGLRSLQSVGGRLYIANLAALDDATLEGLSGVKTVGGDLTISQTPFKKFSGFSLSQVNNLGIYGNGISSIEEIDVSNVDITNTLIISRVSSAFSLKGKNIFTGNLTLDYSTPATMIGFEEVKNLIFSMNLDAQPEHTLNIRKVNGNASITAYNFNTFKMPSLEEVSGIFTLFTAAGIQTVDLPVLKRTGAATLDVAALPVFSLPSLQTVDGDCNITTGKYNVDNLSSLQLSSLTTVNGTLSLSGYSSYYYNSKLTNLDGLATLKNVKGVAISYNMGLTDYTGLKNALPSFNADNWNVSNNNYNPTYQDMADGKYIKP